MLSLRDMFNKVCVEETALPMQDAILAAATQNFERDVSEGLVEAHEKEELFPLYLKEAESVIKTTKQNYRPELPNIDHITLKT